MIGVGRDFHTVEVVMHPNRESKRMSLVAIGISVLSMTIASLSGTTSLYLFLDWIMEFSWVIALVLTAVISSAGLLMLLAWSLKNSRRARSMPETDAERRKRLRAAVLDMDREIERLKRVKEEKSALRVRIATELAEAEPKQDYRRQAKPDD